MAGGDAVVGVECFPAWDALGGYACEVVDFGGFALAARVVELAAVVVTVEDGPPCSAPGPGGAFAPTHQSAVSMVMSGWSSTRQRMIA